MKTILKYLPILILSIITIIGCKKEPAPLFHREYFGLTEGRYVVYNVTEITHDQALNQHDTMNYQLKTKWGDIYIDNEGREAREFLRYIRPTSSDPWSLQDVWTGIIDGIRGELTEENQRTVKLVFAPTLNKEWDANAYNTIGEMGCYYRDIHSDTIVNGYSFDSTVVVEQDQFVSLIDTVRKFELYAKNVGLIYKYQKDNHYQPFNSEVVNGNELYYQYAGSGIE